MTLDQLRQIVIHVLRDEFDGATVPFDPREAFRFMRVHIHITKVQEERRMFRFDLVMLDLGVVAGPWIPTRLTPHQTAWTRVAGYPVRKLFRVHPELDAIIAGLPASRGFAWAE